MQAGSAVPKNPTSSVGTLPSSDCVPWIVPVNLASSDDLRLQQGCPSDRSRKPTKGCGVATPPKPQGSAFMDIITTFFDPWQ
jgi:hypothetical protein